DVDAVIIGSPDHWHVQMTADACKAGKDVYVEKPLTHTIAEGQAAIDAQNQHGRVVQVGTQQRSMPQFIKAREIVQAGTLGAIRKIHMTWNRNQTPFQKRVQEIKPEQVDWKRFLGTARPQPFDAYRFRSWRWFWDFGGGILTDLMVHWLDAVFFMRELGVPAEITTVGDQLATKGSWETPDTIQTLMRFPNHGLQLHFEGTFVNGHNRAGVAIMGEDATLYVDRGRLELIPEARRKIEKLEMIVGGGERGADFSTIDGETLHLNDWLEAIRTRRKPSAPAEAGVSSAEVAHLANQAFREGKVVRVTQAPRG
nr:Gfo/Idh/MocA family oxidoreductase [Verrucomicrobiota bacterium]